MAEVPLYEEGKISFQAESFPLLTPYSKLLPIHPHEICFLMRRRAGIKQKDLAKTLGVSRYWVNAMERGSADCTALVNYWTERLNVAA